MKNIILSIYVSLLLLNSFNNAAAADITISGSAQFQCDLLSKYMKKHGYHYIREIKYENSFKTNLFAAKDGEVIVKNMNNTVLGHGKTDEKGNFSVLAPRENSYQILVRFHGREINSVVAGTDEEIIIVDLGYFDKIEVDGWLQIPALSYCYSCDIRYLENKDSL
jgi:hypothetical protein